MKKNKYLLPTEDWAVEDIDRAWKVIDKLGQAHGWKGYEPQIEIIGAEQMLDRYSSTGLPNLYAHWSFGKRRIQDEKEYYSGQRGLAYEMIINSNPSVCYLMEDNSACMQLLVLAHAAVGHSHFFKHNYMFKEWTDANSILDYLEYAKNYIRKCEDKHGEIEVEQLLDHCHNLQHHGIFLYKREKLSPDKELERLKKHEEEVQKDVSVLDKVYAEPAKDPQLTWIKSAINFATNAHTLEHILKETQDLNIVSNREENILYFMEKHSMWLKPWQREIVRIVRNIAQYFYPQRQTKVMNEGFASFVHYTLMTEMHEKGLISDGFYLEFLKSHTGVLYQPGAMSKHYNGINPYTLGFSIFRDIKRIVTDPTEEDKYWFPTIAGTKDWETVINEAVKHYNDESFILQFLSPKVIRDMKLFAVDVSDNDPDNYLVSAIHDDEDYLEIRKSLSEQYRYTSHIPKLEIVFADPKYERQLVVAYTKLENNPLTTNYMAPLGSIAYLWGFGTELFIMDKWERVWTTEDNYRHFNIYELLELIKRENSDGH